MIDVLLLGPHHSLMTCVTNICLTLCVHFVTNSCSLGLSHFLPTKALMAFYVSVKMVPPTACNWRGETYFLLMSVICSCLPNFLTFGHTRIEESAPPLASGRNSFIHLVLVRGTLSFLWIIITYGRNCLSGSCGYMNAPCITKSCTIQAFLGEFKCQHFKGLRDGSKLL